jgi:DNA-binding HxlR family transcriptional regulator
MWFEPEPPEVEAEREQSGESEHLYRLIGSRWSVPVLRELAGDVVRYNALHRRLAGVSHKMLTQTLRRLQQADLVHRQAHRTTPPCVEYRLTPAGTELLRRLSQLERWASARGLRC